MGTQDVRTLVFAHAEGHFAVAILSFRLLSRRMDIQQRSEIGISHRKNLA